MNTPVLTDYPDLTPFDVADPTAACPDPARGAALLSTIGGERATQGPGNKIVTARGKTHFAWQDSFEQRYFARVRSFDHATGAWSAPVTVAEGVDEHSRPTLAMDSAGHLHVVMGGHNTPLHYRRSLRPHDTTAWTDVEVFGKNTYPVLLCGPDDSLHLAPRAGDHRGMQWWVRPPGGPWESRGLLIGRQDRFSGYTAMQNDLAWGPDQRTLHLSMGFFLGRRHTADEHPRDVAGTYQAIGYLRSRDAGTSWERADGTPVELPATSETLEKLDEGESNDPKPGIAHGGIAVDASDRPYIGWVRHTPEPGAAHLVTRDFDADDWRPLPVAAAIDAHWPGWIPLGLRPMWCPDGTLCVIANLVPREHPAANWSPGVHGRPAFWLRDHPELAQIVWLESADGGETFAPRDVLAREPDEGQQMVSIERANGPWPLTGRPSLLYTRGEWRYAEEGETIDNEVYWVRPDQE